MNKFSQKLSAQSFGLDISQNKSATKTIPKLQGVFIPFILNFVLMLSISNFTTMPDSENSFYDLIRYNKKKKYIYIYTYIYTLKKCTFSAELVLPLSPKFWIMIYPGPHVLSRDQTRFSLRELFLFNTKASPHIKKICLKDIELRPEKP